MQEVLMQYISQNDLHMKLVETQLSSIHSLLSQTAPSTLPSQTKINPKKKHVRAIMTRSKKARENMKQNGGSTSDATKEVFTKENLVPEKKVEEREILTSPKVSIPFPQRVKNKQ